jgi:ABC-type spermidine/putrescine transport system permease subunit II
MIRRLTKAADHTVLIAVLVVSAAVVAAVIAAATATINQRRQLKHDRQMQDLTELRSVLDDAAIALEAAIFCDYRCHRGL